MVSLREGAHRPRALKMQACKLALSAALCEHAVRGNCSNTRRHSRHASRTTRPPMPMHSPSTVVSAARSRTNARRGAPLWCLVLQIGALWVSACGAERTEIDGFDSSEASFDSHAAGGRGAADANATKPGLACESGTVIECKVQLPSQGDVSNCFVGLQVCTDQLWSECLSESDAEERLAAGGD